MFDFLFLFQFAENDGFQINLCPYKGHELNLFYDCIVFHGVYVPRFPCPVYRQWHLGWSYLFVIVNSAAMNVHVHVPS